MLERAEKKKVFRELDINVLKPEDLIGLKLQAIKNNPSRKVREMEDILFLVRTYRNDIDWSIIEEYAKILDMLELYQEILKEK